MVLLLEKFLPVLSHAFTVIKCFPDVMGRSVSITARQFQYGDLSVDGYQESNFISCRPIPSDGSEAS